jgi:hypothetical protein
MSCFSVNSRQQSSRYLLLEDKLKSFISSFQEVRYAAIIDRNGDMISLSEMVPPEYQSYCFTIKSLSEKVLRIFTQSNCKKLKVRGDYKALFSLYVIDDNHVLVFFSEINCDHSRALDPTPVDESLNDLLVEMKRILDSRLEVV